jgi:hypothetical protein
MEYPSYCSVCTVLFEQETNKTKAIVTNATFYSFFYESFLKTATRSVAVLNLIIILNQIM